MTIALVMTVRDEEELLRPNLLYHQFMGVDAAFVYDDGSVDGTAASVADLPFVHIFPTVNPASVTDRPDTDQFVAAAGSHVTARQALNAMDAMERARASGAEWLLAIDADELASIDLHRAEPGQLLRALEAQPPEVEAVIFKPLEAVQRRLEYSAVIAEETLFKRPSGEQRETYDPFTKRVRRVPTLYGHTSGKSAVRLSVDARPQSPHVFVQRDGSRLRTATAGHLLHYYCHSFDAFVRKFRNFRDHPDHHLQGGDVVLQKRLWRDVVNRSGLDDDELREYYRRWVMFGEEEVDRLARPSGFGPLKRVPVLVEVTAPQAVLAAIGEA